MGSGAELVLLAGAVLRVPARRLRALARGDDGALRDWIANESAQRLAEARRDARAALERVLAAGGRVVTLADPEYPAGVRELADPPAFLIVRGRLGRSPWREGVAIVGTREADEEATAMARALAGRSAGPVVSGLACGVDAAAHEGALAAGVATIAYVGNGLGATYPAEHRELEERIVEAGGAVASEMLPGEKATRWSLVRRDRLQAAHAAAVVLVQSELGGGAMHTMGFARELGRPRFALEPRAGGRYDGNARAIDEGAVALPWELEVAMENVRSGFVRGALRQAPLRQARGDDG
ncbi:MAG: DNA-processing protein DprA [Candidatus Baltobacteraceae bacterium]